MPGLGPDMAMLFKWDGRRRTKTGWRRLICAGLIFTGECETVKAGGAAGFIKRSDRVENSEQAAATRHVGVRGHQ